MNRFILSRCAAMLAILCIGAAHATETPGDVQAAPVKVDSYAGPEDFSWVKRELKKAPAFKSEKVRYMIWVLGDGRKSVLVMAWDESEGTGKGYDTLYFDTNFNGDLTEDGKKLFWKHLEPNEKGRLGELYDIPEIKEADGPRKFKMHFESHAGSNYLGYSSSLDVSWPEKNGYHIHLHNTLNWSNDLATAPIYHWGGVPVPFINGKAPGQSLGTWEAGTHVDAWYQISQVGDKLANVLNFPYGSFPGGAASTSLRLLNTDGSTRDEVALSGGCACGGGFGHHLQLSFRLPPGKHMVVARIPRPDYMGGPAEYLYPVEISNPGFGKPLNDPGYAALKATAGGAVHFASLRRATTPAQLEKSYPEENPAAARVSDTSLQTDWAEGTGVSTGYYGESEFLELGDRPKNTMPLTQRFLLKFDLSGFSKDTKIIGAQIRLTIPRTGNTGANAKLEAYAMRRDWNENKQADGYACLVGPKYIDKNPAAIAWGKPGAEDSQTDRFAEPAATVSIAGFPAKADPKNPNSAVEDRRLIALDITELAKKWRSGELANNGILVKMTGDGGIQCYSSESEELTFRPTLVVAYEGPGPQSVFTPRPGEDLEQALADAKKTHRPVLVKFFSPTCGVCKKVQDTTLTDNGVKELIEKQYQSVSLRIEDHAQLAQDLGVSAVPTAVILNDSGEKKAKLEAPTLLDVNAFRQALTAKDAAAAK